MRCVGDCDGLDGVYDRLDLLELQQKDQPGSEAGDLAACASSREARPSY